MYETEINPAGLYTFPNNFSKIPKGALVEAINVVLDRDGIISSRRGFKAYSTSLGATVTHATTFTSFQDGIILHKAVTNKLARDVAGTFTEYTGTYSKPSSDNGSRIRFITANKNLYFATAAGVYKLDSLTGTPVSAGAPRGFGGTGATTGGSGFMTNSVNVAYRIAWGIKDANNNLILGVPSERIVVSNSSGGTRNVSLTFQVPDDITVNWFYQVYRSNESATLSDIPDDEMQQVYENNPTAGEITARSITITDSVPNDLKQATLYTSPSQQGFENANYKPPFANDIVTYKDQTFYANTRRNHTTNFTLISVNSPGVVVGNTVTFTASGGSPSFVLTAAAAENAATGAFKVTTTGTPAQNIEDTAKSLIRIMNSYASNTFLNGYYISGFDQLPGQMMIERDDTADTYVAITSNNGNAFTPILPATGTTIKTAADVKPNVIYISKLNQPEHVPLYRYLSVGTADAGIIRILALRDGVIVLKPDGIFRISGYTFENMRVSPLDTTTKILAPNSAVVLANQVFFFGDQGVVACSDSGVAIVSRAIEKTLLTLSSSIYANFAEATFAVGYESDRKYILFTVSATGDTIATKAFVYNTVTNSWTTWDRTQTAGFVNPTNNKFYLSEYNAAGAARVFIERKDFTRLDYADEEFAVNIVSVSNTAVVLTSTAVVVKGMTLKQGTAEAVVETIIDGTHIIVSRIANFAAGAASVYEPITNSIKMVPTYGSNPLLVKHFQEANLLFDDASFSEIDVNFVSDFTAVNQEVVLKAVGQGQWGQSNWGSLPWGGQLGGAQRIRTYIPTSISRANWIQISIEIAQAFSSFDFCGFSVLAENTSTRMR